MRFHFSMTDPIATIPFRLPLCRPQFRAAVRSGHGRALMHLTRCGVTGFEDLIVRACLRDLRYDPQCENPRVDWLVRLLTTAGLDIVDRLLDTMTEGGAGNSREEGDAETEARRRDLAQHCRLAFHFARHGHRALHTALYAAFDADARSEDPVAAAEIIDLDGADGLIHIASRLGALVADEPTVTVSDAPFAHYDHEHGPGSADRLLWSAARGDRAIASFVMRLPTGSDADAKEVSRFLDVQTMTVTEIVRAIEAEDPDVGEVALCGWGRKAQRWELMALVGRLYRETRPGRLALYLSVFQSRAVPIFHRRLVRYAEHDDPEVRWYAVRALAHHRHPEVRNLARRRAEAGRHTDRELRLFCRNYREGDWGRIESGLALPAETDQEHSVLCDLIDVFEENPGPDARTPLLLVYERSPCSICREAAVDLLLDGGQAPAWLIEECRYDGNEEIRALVAAPDCAG